MSQTVCKLLISSTITCLGGNSGVQPSCVDLIVDKFIALEEDKALFVHQLIISSKALNIVEAETSYGVSTIYLALAVAEVERLTGKSGKVIGTEHEVGKAHQARKHWQECGSLVENRIELKVGDLRETLKTGLQEIDFLLLDSKQHWYSQR